MITDPWFYLVAVPAVLLFGISKGGFGGGLGVIAVLLMALVISPLQAAAMAFGVSLPLARSNSVKPSSSSSAPMAGLIAG